ncbi:hypothetical protein [Actinomadura geliboluensis]|uniref:Uncharacterized protein n=1 Tax=Actinomadura geliboluensis TaxID=882440 RepID=A0A5S4GYY1_9ACTN|nr:hypothetical protein [Actinomadura geliboluensis]TMR38175.1 hypothetical protein ETD96_16945 [Actinomadura geliboluensis]
MSSAHGDTLAVTLSPAQANMISLALDSGITTEPQWGDPRGIAEDCLAIKSVLGWHDAADQEVQVELTTRQWDVVVAELDKDALTRLQTEEEDEATERLQARDTVLTQVGHDLPEHSGQQPTTVQQHLEPGEAGYYTLFQPPRGGWRTGLAYGRPDATTGLPIRAAVPGRGLAIAAGTPAVEVTMQILADAPETDLTAWAYVAEVSQQWISHPYAELILAVPDQEGTVLPELSTQVWPNVVYRVRLSVRNSGNAEEEHRVQLWPGHAAPSVELKRP